MRAAPTMRIAAGAVAVAALALLPVAADAGSAGAKAKPVRETVGVFSNYYEPARLRVPVGSTIVWKWPAVTGASHDVTLEKGPKGVKKFQSEIAASQYVYRRKLTVAGRYHIICSLHEGMAMDITVR